MHGNLHQSFSTVTIMSYFILQAHTGTCISPFRQWRSWAILFCRPIREPASVLFDGDDHELFYSAGAYGKLLSPHLTPLEIWERIAVALCLKSLWMSEGLMASFFHRNCKAHRAVCGETLLWFFLCHMFCWLPCVRENRRRGGILPYHQAQACTPLEACEVLCPSAVVIVVS